MNRYGAPTTYKRITPDRGCGFILKRIYELSETSGREYDADSDPRRQDVYFGTKWANRPGFASLLWSALIKNGLIESNGGIQNYKCCGWFYNSHIAYRAAGTYVPGAGYTVRYRLTPFGRAVLFDMMDRVKAKGKALNSVGSVAEFDAKKDEERSPVKAGEESEDVLLEPGETPEEWAARQGATLIFKEKDVPEEPFPTESQKPQVERENQIDVLKQILDAVNRLCDILTKQKMGKAK